MYFDVIHQSVCTRKQVKTEIFRHIEILARTHLGKMARMVILCKIKSIPYKTLDAYCAINRILHKCKNIHLFAL